jgi:hypothetical protein
VAIAANSIAGELARCIVAMRYDDLPSARIRPLFEALENLETLPVIGALTAMIEPRPGDAAAGRAAE